MKTLLRRFQRLLAVSALLAVGVAQAASPYYVRVTGTPAGITCDTTQFAFQVGATLSWNLMNGSSLMGDGSLYINGGYVGKQAVPFQSQAGSTSLSGPVSSVFTYPPQTFPYTVRIDFVPRDPGTDGVSVSFNCPNNSIGGGNGFTSTVITSQYVSLQASPVSLLFTGTVVGATSAPKAITITNTGNLDATGVTVALGDTANFELQSNTCGTTIAVNASCAIGVAFSPRSAGARSTTLTVGTGGGAAVTVNVTGTGQAQLSIPSQISLGSQTVGTSGAPQAVTVTNGGTTPVTVSSVTSSNSTEFVTSTSCATLAPAASCTINVIFHPAASGARSATITVTSDGAGSPQTIAATGQGTGGGGGGGQLVLPSAMSFGTQNVGTPSAPIVATVTNSGGAAVAVSSIASSVPSEFAVSANTCGTVQPGQQCSFSVIFTPSATGARSGTITVTSDGQGSPQIVAASGTGSSAPTPGQLSFPETVDAGTVQVGSTSEQVGVPVSNTGGVTVHLAGIASSNPAEFAVGQNNCAAVASGEACSFTFTFTPSAVGQRVATFTLTSDGAGSPQTMTVTGQGSATPPASTTIDIIEYQHAEWNHYFMTGIADEIAKLDAGVFEGWKRTGRSFKGYPLGTANSNVVCRYFSTSFGLKSSHFYGALPVDCIGAENNPDWKFEGDVFNIPVPDIKGTCPAETIPVYRLYNDGQGGAPNHRYTTDLGVRAQMISEGWIPEGYGDIGVIMCSPR